MLTLAQLATDLATSRTTSRQLVEDCLERISDPSGEGKRAFIAIDADKVRAAADLADRARGYGLICSPYAGIPISIKDLFDVRGEITRAGSKIFDSHPPAERDAMAVARLRAAGFVLIGRTNMPEFAYSGLGINPHYGTPLNPYDRQSGRVPGGSTSGGAVSVTDRMAAATIGSDTGGSCRIPAAVCGIVGFKPTAFRVSQEGTIPLAPSLDSVGWLGNSVRCCIILDTLLSGVIDEVVAPPSVAGLRLAVANHYVMDGLDTEVANAFARAIETLSRQGATVSRIDTPELTELPNINVKGGLIAAEAFAWHRPFLERQAEHYDPWIRVRLDMGRAQAASDYLDTLKARAELKRRMAERTAGFDAVVMPTTAIIAPRVADVAEREASTRSNILLARNTSVVNFLDRCAISIPCHHPGEAPVGLMLTGEHANDRRLLAVAEAVEGALATLRIQ